MPDPSETREAGTRHAGLQGTKAGIVTYDTTTGWMDDAPCQGMTHLFYPNHGESAKDAIEICRTCRFVEECLSHAIENKETMGVRGGLTPNDRRKMARGRGKCVKCAATFIPSRSRGWVCNGCKSKSARLADKRDGLCA